MTSKHLPIAAVAAALATASWLVFAQHNHDVAAHDQAAKSAQRAAATDHRVPVTFPAELREHTFANMRDHLLALQEIQAALATGKYDHASNVAEQRLGMTSLTAHGAHEVAQYMPKGMQEAGTAMHRSASRLSTAALDAAVTKDVRPALAALAEVTANCVACHAAYRLQ
jgi:cytochrome c556